MDDVIRPMLTPPGGEKKVLLHSCCAPCSGEVMEAMLASGINYTIFFYNPIIHPEREYLAALVVPGSVRLAVVDRQAAALIEPLQ